MQLGIEIDWRQHEFRVPIERVLHAESLGYDAVFTAEGNGSDALTPLGYIAGLTRRIRLGTAIAPTGSRTPSALAMAFQTIDAMAGGDRVIVGLGSSLPHYVEAWHGRPWGSPYRRMRDCIGIMRRVFAGDSPLAYDGLEMQLPYRGPGHLGQAPFAPIMKTNPRLPILMGAGSPTMIRLAAEIADGWIPLGFAPGMMRTYRPWLVAGAERAGRARSLDGFAIWAHLDIIEHDDVRVPIDRFKAIVARWIGEWSPGGTQPNFFKEQLVLRGHGAAAQRIAELWATGHEAEAVHAVPDEFIDDGWLVGPRPRILERLRRWLDSGATGLIVRTESDEMLARVAAAVR
ncbi:MAG: LLM class flavin-dependent oxidoreductase [Gammaproteobacteria bacterium]